MIRTFQGESGRRWAITHRPGRLHRVAAAAVAIALALGGMTSTAAAAAESAGRSIIVKTTDGKLRGVSADGAQKFLGLPYAAPPVDDLRLAPPAPAAPWKGMRDASVPSAACAQSEVPNSGQPTSEDCLYLDVYRPAPQPKATPLPVIVWIHGGGFGGGSGGLFDATELARSINAIIVTINYRLGALGYLAVDEMGDAAGNFGLMDQIAALEWVKRNISAFGGDPQVVTVAGQSAGAMSICGILASPLSEGLVSRAILQSGPCTFPVFTPRTDAVAQGETVAASLGCADSAHRLTCLRALDPSTLLAVPARWTITAGVPSLPMPPGAAVAAGQWAKVPLLIGSTRYEGKQGLYFTVGLSAGSMTAAEYEAKVRQFYPSNADAILAEYPASAYEMPAYALAAIDTDSGFGCLSYEFAQQAASQVTVFQYEFDDPTSPTQKGLRIPGLDMSSAHTAELAYLFDYADVERPLTAHEEVLAARMKSYWGAFAASAQLGAPWAPVTTASHPVLRLQSSGDTSFTTFSDEHNCGFWATQQ